MELTLKHIAFQKPFRAVPVYCTVSQAVKVMNKYNLNAIGVAAGDQLVGIFTKTDLVRKVIARDLDPDKLSIIGVATRKMIIGRSTHSYRRYLKKVQQNKIQYIVVVENRRVIGILSASDILAVAKRQKEAQLRYVHLLKEALENVN